MCIAQKTNQESEEYHRTNTSSYCRDEWSILCVAIRRAVFDKFGEEGLKAGVSTAEGG